MKPSGCFSYPASTKREEKGLGSGGVSEGLEIPLQSEIMESK